jgi:hypothetical protein
MPKGYWYKRMSIVQATMPNKILSPVDSLASIRRYVTCLDQPMLTARRPNPTFECRRYCREADSKEVSHVHVAQQLDVGYHDPAALNVHGRLDTI